MTYNELYEFVRNKITVLGEQGKEGFSQELLLEHGYYSSCSMILRTLDKFFPEILALFEFEFKNASEEIFGNENEIDPDYEVIKEQIESISGKELLELICKAVTTTVIYEFELHESLGSFYRAEMEVYSVPSYAILSGNVMITEKAFDAMMEYDEDKTNMWISKCLLTLEKSEQKGEE